MDTTSTLPQYEPEPLERSPLALVVAQISFPTILSISTDDSLLAQFQDKIRDQYPILLIGHQVGFNIGPSGVEQQQAPTRTFQFTDSERQWTVALAANAISLETRNYKDIDEFASRLLKVTVAAKDTYRLSVQERVGLRYVNEIRYPGAETPAAWRPLIKPELLGPLSDDNIVPSVRTAYQELSLGIPDGELTIRHGFVLQGTTVALVPGANPPSEPLGPFYLFDLDAFDTKGGEMDNEMLDGLLKSYNKTVYSLFRWGLTEEAVRVSERLYMTQQTTSPSLANHMHANATPPRDLEENLKTEQWNTSYDLLAPRGMTISVVTGGASEIHPHRVPFFATRRADPLVLLVESLETVKDVYSLRDLPPDWNGSDVEAPDYNAIENAASWIVHMYWDALGTGRGWYKPHVTVDEDGGVMFEWWNGNKALTIYVSEDDVSYIKGWGLDIENEMEDGEATTSESRSSLWTWLMN